MMHTYSYIILLLPYGGKLLKLLKLMRRSVRWTKLSRNAKPIIGGYADGTLRKLSWVASQTMKFVNREFSAIRYYVI